MEEKKDNKLLKIIVIVLGVIVLCALGYIIYDKCFNTPPTNVEKQNEELNNETVEEVNEDEDIKLDYIVLNYPKALDSEVTGYNIRKEFDLSANERHKASFTFNYKNYKVVYNYIDGSVDTSEIKIYNNDKEVYSNVDIKTLISSENNDVYESLNFFPIISNGKLHLLAYNIKNCYLNESSEKVPPLEYLQIDLTSDEIKVETIKSIKFELAKRYIPGGEVRMCE